MSIGISDEHVELAASLRKWAAGARRRARRSRAAEGDADARFDEVWKAVGEMGVADDRLPEAAGGGGGRARPGGRARGLRPRAGARPAARAGGRAARCVDDAARRRRRRPRARPGLDVVWDAPSATHLLAGDAEDRWFLVPAEAATVTPAPGARPVPPVRHGRGRPADAASPVPGLTARAGPSYGGDVRRRRGLRRGPLVPGHRGRVRQGARAVRQADRQLPGGQAPVRRDAGDRRGGDRRGLGRRAGAASGDDEQWAFAADVAAATALRRRGRGRQVLHPGARRDRLHLRARRPPLPAPGAVAARRWSATATRRPSGCTAAAVAGVRRRVEVDLEGRDEPIRDEVRATVGGSPACRTSGARRWSRPAT